MSLLLRKRKVHERQDRPELTDLIDKMQRGEEAALGQLYDLTVAKVYALALRITANPPDAEEVTCDVYQQLWRTARSFDCKRGNPSQWIMVIARSRALDRYRERRTQAATLHLADSGDSYLTDGRPMSDQLVQQFQVGSIVQAEIAKLSTVQAQLIGLAFFRGLSHQEIADETRLPLGTVKSHISRALTTLRKALADTDRAL